MSKKITIIIALFSALIGVFIILGYITKVEEEASLEANLVPVIVAKKYIPKYSIISPDMVRIEMIPSKYIQPGSLSSIKELVDNKGTPRFVTTVPILEDEIILTTKLSIPGRATGLSVVVPKGKRAIVIPVGEASLSSGLIKPGDRIDLIATFEDKSVILLQNLVVLSVGEKILGESKKVRERKRGLVDIPISTSGGVQAISLAVTPTEALKISFARDKCSFNIVLRNNLDNEIVKIPPVNRANLIGTPVTPKKEITIYEGDRIIREFLRK